MAKKWSNDVPAEPFVISTFEMDGLWHADVVAPTGEVVETTDGVSDEWSAVAIAEDWVKRKLARDALRFREKQFV